MAENPQVLRKRIRTAQSISQIAKAMEMIAASKIKRAQVAVERNRPYADKIAATVEHILCNTDVRNFEHPYIQKNASERKLLVAISPDKGLCGGLNANLYRKLMEFDATATDVVSWGKKIERFSARYGFNLVASFRGSSSFPVYEAVFPALDIINDYYLKKKVSEVHVLFTSYQSRMSQVPVSLKLLPVEAVNCPGTTGTAIEEIPYVFEPDAGGILRELLPYYLEVRLYNALIQAFTSEQAARMVAMQNAKENAAEIGESLTRSYNRLRQERITGEILDLSNGRQSA